MRTRPLLIALIALSCIAVTGGTAAANVNTTLSISSYSHMVVDGTHGHVFVSGDGPATTAPNTVIEVMNTNGTLDTTIPGESNASGMALSDDKTILYVALCGQDQIDEIDTATLTNVGHFTAAVGGSCNLALANGLLWYSSGAPDHPGDLTSVTLDASHTETPTSVTLSFASFAAVPNHSDWLVAGDSGIAKVLLEDITDPANVTQISASVTPAGSQLTDVTVLPSGGAVVAAFQGQAAIRTLALPNLNLIAPSYRTTAFPNAVAASSPAGEVAAAGGNATSPVQLSTYRTGTQTPVTLRTLGPSTAGSHSIAFSANGAFIYAVTGSASGAPVFRTVQTVPLTQAQFSIKRSAAAITIGKPVTLTVHLGVKTANRTVSIYRQPYSASSPTLAHTGVVNAAGNLTYVVHPGMDTIYSVKWAGDATHLAVNPTKITVQVRMIVHHQSKGGYATSNGIRLYHYAASCVGASHTGCPTFQGWATPAQPNRQVKVVVEGLTKAGNWVTIVAGTATAGPGGKLIVHVIYKNRNLIGVQERIRFSFANSQTMLGAASTWLPFRVTT